VLGQYIDSVAHVERKPDHSDFWTGLIKFKESLLSLGTFHLNNGENIRFWEDKWIVNACLKYEFPWLYNITHRKNAIVASVLIQ
jgi:hypothetical protein